MGMYSVDHACALCMTLSQEVYIKIKKKEAHQGPYIVLMSLDKDWSRLVMNR